MPTQKAVFEREIIFILETKLQYLVFLIFYLPCLAVGQEGSFPSLSLSHSTHPHFYYISFRVKLFKLHLTFLLDFILVHVHRMCGE